VDRRIFIFGGGEGPSYYNSLYIHDTVSRKWTHINPPEPLPLPRRAHTTVLYRNKLYIFGGGNGVKALNDVWSLDTSIPVERMKWELLKTHGERPGPRGYHTANLVGNIMIVIGGSDGRDCFSDIWVLNLGTSMLSPFPPPFLFISRRCIDVYIWEQIPSYGRWSRQKKSTSGSRIPRRKSGASCSSWEDTMASSTRRSYSSSTLVRPS
jgi:Galactose oxidase, central domain/Kelch motif